MEERLPGQNPTLETRHAAYEKIDKKKRYSQIIEVLSGGKEMTAKEIAVEMWNRGYIPSSERNFTAPRLTEMSQKGIVEPVGKQLCQWTHKMVAVYKIRNLGGNL